LEVVLVEVAVEVFVAVAACATQSNSSFPQVDKGVSIDRHAAASLAETDAMQVTVEETTVAFSLFVLEHSAIAFNSALSAVT
jgi:hypothetical protein